MKLRAQFLFFGLLPVVVLQLVVVVVVLNALYSQLLHYSLHSMADDLDSAARKIDAANARAVNVAQMMAIAQESGQFGRRNETSLFQKAILEAYPEFTGVAVCYEPNGDGQDEANREGTPHFDSRQFLPTGRYLPYWFRDRNDPSKLRVEALHDADTSFYYRAVKNRFLSQPETTGLTQTGDLSVYYAQTTDPDTARIRPLITEPYSYDGKMIVEDSYPIVINGQFKGVADIDRALTFIQTDLADFNPFPSTDFILLSSRGRVIAATMDPSLVTKTIEQTPYNEVLRDFYLQNQSSGLRRVKEADGKVYFYTGMRIATGRWTLVMRVAEADVLGPLWHTVRQAAALALGGLAVLVIVLTWRVGKVARRLQEAAEASGRVAQGDLTIQLDDASRDESGLLIRAIRDMVAELNSLVGQVKRSSIQLVSSATQIAAASKQQERAITHFGSSTGEIAAAVKEISTTSRELVGTMDEVTVAGTETATMVEAGRSNLAAMESAMTHLAKATGSISTRLAVINDKANKISQVVTTIGKVSEQTNLLSLNAAIEAEKAGEYGLGFAVVAREIRRLADQTSVASLDIERMVKEMQSSVASGVMEMDKFTEEVRREVEGTRNIHQQFTEIIEKVEALPGRFESVHQGMLAQSEGAQQINDAMAELTEAARHSAGALKDFNQAATELHETVKTLQEEVARFKVKS